MLERLLERHWSRLQTQLGEDKGKTTPLPISIYDRQTRRAIGDQVAQQQSRARRQDRYQQVKDLQAQGLKIIQIARQLHLSRQTVRRYSASDHFPEQTRPPRRPSIIDPYVGYLQERWDGGCHENEQLWREIQLQGYRGSIRPLVQWTMLRREQLQGNQSELSCQLVQPGEVDTPRRATASGLKPPLPAVRRLVWLLLRPGMTLDQPDQVLLQSL